MRGGLHIVTVNRKRDDEELNRPAKDGGDTSNERTMPKFKVVWTQQDFCKAASYWMR